jgi:hypothetical protein
MCSIFPKVASLFIAALFLSSCAATTLVDSWRDPGLTGQKFHKLLVISIGKKGSNRRIYEGILVSELNQRGVDAVPGHKLLKSDEKVGQQILEKAVKEAGAEAVLTLQTTKVEQQTTVQPGYAAPYPGYWSPAYFPSWNLYGYYGSSMYYEPPYLSTYEVATILVSLFDGQNGKLLWAANIQTTEPAQDISVGKDLARIVIDSLIGNGLI